METNRQRVGYLDIAKGIGIILVILAHIGISDRLDTWMYSFHLPLFYVISGYCFNFKPEFTTFLKRRIKKCVIPYFCLGLVVVLVESYTGYLYEKGLKNNFIRFVLQKRYSTLWFLATLFMASMIFWLVVKISREKPWLVLVVSVLFSLAAYAYAILIWEPVYWNLDVAMFINVFMGFGYFLSHEDKLKNAIEKVKKSLPVRLVLMLVFLFANSKFSKMNYKLTNSRMDMYWNQYGLYPYTLIAAISGTLFVILLSYTLYRIVAVEKLGGVTFLIKGLQSLGKNSIIYFAWHQSVIMAPMMDYMKKMHIPAVNAKVYVFIGIMIICTIADLVIRNTKLRVMIGE